MTRGRRSIGRTFRSVMHSPYHHSLDASEGSVWTLVGHPKGHYIRDYLAASFPDATVDEFEWVERDSWGYRVRIDHTIHQLLVASEFFDDAREEEIEAMLRAWNVVEFLKRAGEEWVLLTSTGPRIGLPQKKP